MVELGAVAGLWQIFMCQKQGKKITAPYFQGYRGIFLHSNYILWLCLVFYAVSCINPTEPSRTDKGGTEILVQLATTNIRVLDSELRETQTTNYFSGSYPADCAVPPANA